MTFFFHFSLSPCNFVPFGSFESNCFNIEGWWIWIIFCLPHVTNTSIAIHMTFSLRQEYSCSKSFTFILGWSSTTWKHFSVFTSFCHVINNLFFCHVINNLFWNENENRINFFFLHTNDNKYQNSNSVPSKVYHRITLFSKSNTN